MKKKPFVMESRYDGYCKKCKRTIHKGDNITRDEMLGAWIHLKCPTNGSKKTFKQLVSAKAIVTEEGEGTIAEITEKKEFIPSKYQQAIFDWVKYGVGNAVVEAVAGSGKTTTIVKALDIIPTDRRILFLAFNKHIVKELKGRVPKHIRVATLHSLGFSIIRKLEDFRDLDEEKVTKILDEFWSINRDKVPDQPTRSRNRNKRSAMRKVVSLCKATLVDYNDQDQVLGIINRFHIEIDEQDEQEVIERLPYVMQKNNEDLEIIDYDDMTYLPVAIERLRLHCDKYDFILVDEGQDLNLCNIELVLNFLAPNGRIVVVGDRYQSLYAFRGADPRAIPRMIERLSAVTLPLSITYRCPKASVKRVQHLVPNIQAAETAIEGKLESIFYKDLVDHLQEGDMVLCRANAPLVKPAFETIQRGIKAIIRGKDIGRELVNFIERFQADGLGNLEVLMTEYVEKEKARLIDKGRELQAEDLKDKFETIMIVSQECRTVEDLTSKLQILFSDDNAGVVFSSIHKAKGLEARNIFVLREDLLPHPKAKGEDELQQEANCEYVAFTRSLENIYTVIGEDK